MLREPMGHLVMVDDCVNARDFRSNLPNLEIWGRLVYCINSEPSAPDPRHRCLSLGNIKPILNAYSGVHERLI